MTKPKARTTRRQGDHNMVVTGDFLFNTLSALSDKIFDKTEKEMNKLEQRMAARFDQPSTQPFIPAFVKRQSHECIKYIVREKPGADITWYQICAVVEIRLRDDKVPFKKTYVMATARDEMIANKICSALSMAFGSIRDAITNFVKSYEQ